MGGGAMPERRGIYKNIVVDSSRWNGFVPREGDIIISTPPKAGTTWTQMICALLIFQTSDFGKRLSDFTPWVDLKTVPIEQVLDTYAAQTHRRFIKTHTPLDGLPYFAQARYVVVGRDPRDAFLSMDNHRKNTSPEFMKLIAKNSGVAAQPAHDARQPDATRPSATPQQEPDLCAQFRDWITAEGEGEGAFNPNTSSVLHHLASFWAFRDLPNIFFLHYADMKRDLAGEMARLARYLDIAVPADVMPKLVEAAGFEQMRQNADSLAPNAHKGIWRENARFFNKGEVGQWKNLLGAEELRVYRDVMDRFDPEFVDWIEGGRQA